MIVMDDFGVDLEASADVTAAELISAFKSAVQSKSRSVWTIGDLYNVGSQYEEFGEALDAASISLRTAQNYASLCTTWPKRSRVIPVSPSHYLAACALAKSDMRAALGILQTAYDGTLDRDFVRDACAKALGEYTESVEIALLWDWSSQKFQLISGDPPDWLPDGYTITKTVRKP